MPSSSREIWLTSTSIYPLRVYNDAVDDVPAPRDRGDPELAYRSRGGTGSRARPGRTCESGRTPGTLDWIEALAAAPVDDVADAVARREALVVVVVAGQDELDAVLLEERHPRRTIAELLRYPPQVHAGWWKTTIFHLAVDAGSTFLSHSVWTELTRFELRMKNVTFPTVRR